MLHDTQLFKNMALILFNLEDFAKSVIRKISNMTNHKFGVFEWHEKNANIFGSILSGMKFGSWASLLISNRMIQESQLR